LLKGIRDICGTVMTSKKKRSSKHGLEKKKEKSACPERFPRCASKQKVPRKEGG